MWLWNLQLGLPFKTPKPTSHLRKRRTGDKKVGRKASDHLRSQRRGQACAEIWTYMVISLRTFRAKGRINGSNIPGDALKSQQRGPKYSTNECSSTALGLADFPLVCSMRIYSHYSNPLQPIFTCCNMSETGNQEIARKASSSGELVLSPASLRCVFL